jgi:hypothetical protein
MLGRRRLPGHGNASVFQSTTTQPPINPPVRPGVELTQTQAPSLSGTWKLEPLAPECRGLAGSSGGASGCSDGISPRIVCGQSLSIEISAEAIKVQRIVNREARTMVFPLDGSPVKHPLPRCRNFPPDDPAAAKLIEAEMAKAEGLFVAGSDDMTTRATRDGSAVVLHTSHTTLHRVDGTPPWSTVEQTHRLSLSPLGHLIVETDRTFTDRSPRTDRTKSKVVYARTKAFDLLLHGHSRTAPVQALR